MRKTANFIDEYSACLLCCTSLQRGILYAIHDVSALHGKTHPSVESEREVAESWRECGNDGKGWNERVEWPPARLEANTDRSLQQFASPSYEERRTHKEGAEAMCIYCIPQSIESFAVDSANLLVDLPPTHQHQRNILTCVTYIRLTRYAREVCGSRGYAPGAFR